jgi:hypothetical protein
MRTAVRAPLASALVAPLLLLAACGGSQETGTQIDPSVQSEPPTYEVVSEEPGDDGETDVTVSVEEVPTEEALRGIAAELREERGDGVYDLEVVCGQGGEDIAELRWATGDAALADSGLEDGEVEADVDTDATCGTDG